MLGCEACFHQISKLCKFGNLTRVRVLSQLERIQHCYVRTNEDWVGSLGDRRSTTSYSVIVGGNLGS